METTMKLYPRIASAYEVYLICRITQFLHLRTEERGGKRVKDRIVQFVIGFSWLPDVGSALDQGCWLTSVFEQFKSGENAAAMERLK